MQCKESSEMEACEWLREIPSYSFLRVLLSKHFRPCMKGDNLHRKSVSPHSITKQIPHLPSPSLLSLGWIEEGREGNKIDSIGPHPLPNLQCAKGGNHPRADKWKGYAVARMHQKGLKGRICPSSKAPGSETPKSHPILKLGEFPLPIIGPLG